MQTSRLPRRLMDYITYGFFESIKNKANQKVHSTQKIEKEFSSSLRSKSVPSFSSVCWLKVFTAQVRDVLVWSFCHLGSKVKETSSGTQSRWPRLTKNFPLNKYGRVYPAKRSLSLLNASPRLHKPPVQTGVCCLPCLFPFPRVLFAISPCGELSLSGPIVIVRGAACG